MTKLLEHLSSLFKKQELDAEILEETLLVYVDPTVEVTVKKQELGEKIETDYFLIQFRAKLNVTTKDSALFDTGSLLHYLNRHLDLPGFELDEGDLGIEYRYILMSAGFPDEKLILAILGLIGFYLRLNGELIETVATGKKSFNEILQEILELA